MKLASGSWNIFRAKSAKGRGILNILGNKRLSTWAKRNEIYFRRRKKNIGNTIWMRVKGNKIYFGVLDYDLVLFSLPAPPISVYLPPLCKSVLTKTYFNIFLKSVK